MASSIRRAIRPIENSGADIAEQVLALREEISSLADAVARYSGHSANDLGHNALELASQVSHQGAVAARNIGRQANAAGRVVRDNPVPALVALGTVALIAALVFTRDEHHLW